MTLSRLALIAAILIAASTAHATTVCNIQGTSTAPKLRIIPPSMGKLPVTLQRIAPAAGCANQGTGGRHVGHIITPGWTTGAPNVVSGAPQPPLGTTAATVAADFPAVYLYNIQHNPTYDAQFGLLDDYMLATLSNEYIRNNGNVTTLMNLMATKLTAAHLVRLKAAFGTAVDTAVTAAAPAAIKAQYHTYGAPANLRMSHAQYISMGIGGYFPEKFSLTQYQLFLEYEALPNATVATALVKMASFEAQVLYSDYQFSYWVGGKLVAILDHVDPNINIEIGNILGTVVTDIVDMVSTPLGNSYVDLPGFYDYNDTGDFNFDWDWYDWF
jgi:hypothetical protein